MFRRFAAIAVIAIAGCDAPPIAKEPLTASAPRPPDPPPLPAASGAPAAPAPPPGPRFGMTELATTQGDLLPLLTDHGERAKAKGLVPVVYFYANWCAPCRVFQQNMKAPEIAEALDGVYLVKIDMDEWHDKLKGTGFTPKKIPSFYFITSEGRPSGKMIDGDKWSKATPATMGAALKAFLHPPP